MAREGITQLNIGYELQHADMALLGTLPAQAGRHDRGPTLRPGRHRHDRPAQHHRGHDLSMVVQRSPDCGSMWGRTSGWWPRTNGLGHWRSGPGRILARG